MLARNLTPRLEAAGCEVNGCDLPEVDITRPDQVTQRVRDARPDLLINCAAYTAVDRAESEPDLAAAANTDGPAVLADACCAADIPLIHVSTDYVFDGSSDRPYRPDDPAGPMSVYGRTKWLGEEAVRARHARHLIVRTAWLYGEHGPNFVTTMLRLGREKDQIEVVDDQSGCPTWTGDLAAALVIMALRTRTGTYWGTYHFCGEGITTWCGLARAVFEEARRFEALRVQRVLPITTEQYPTAAKRPAWSVLDCARTAADFGIHPRPWRLGLKEMLEGVLSRENA